MSSATPPRANSLTEWLNCLAQQPAKSRETLYKLDNVRTVANRLQLLPVTRPVITIGGTNGKGSTLAICEAILRAAGYCTGANFSPHLQVFNERIRINNQYATNEQICAAFEVIDRARADIALSYFEFATLAALWLFQQFPVDIYLLEVGMGGRLDTVNIIDADVAVITSIDLDHTEWLGHTRGKIAREKAGIFRPQRPAICGDLQPPIEIVESAQQIGANLKIVGRDYFFASHSESWSWWNAHVHYKNLPLPASLLLQNAATALAAITALFPHISLAAIKKGLRDVYLPGRWQIKTSPIWQVFDVAHNPASAQLLAKKLSELPRTGKNRAVVGMLKDKDIAATLFSLQSQIDIWYCATLSGYRGASAQTLAAQLPPSAKHFCYDSPQLAYEAALSASAPDDRLIIFGSFHTVGQILKTAIYK